MSHLELTPFQMGGKNYLSELFPLKAYQFPVRLLALRKHAYSNVLKILPPKNVNFQMKNSGSFHISAQNIDCGYLLDPPRRGGSNKYPKSVFLSSNMKIDVYPL